MNKFGLYNEQLEALEATNNNKEGIVIMPPGCGKTYIQSAVMQKILKTTQDLECMLLMLLALCFRFN